MNTLWKFSGLLQSDGWLEPAYVGLDDDGKIVYLAQDAPTDVSVTENISGWAVPGFVNAHSHAFQYAMAGLAEHLAPQAVSDDFWSWREEMYGLALRLTPEQMEAIASMVYLEMVRLGYTSVAEFHYLHHSPEGKPYLNLAEMGERLLRAADRAGLDITLIPIYYNQGDFGEPALPKQRRFISQSVDHYFRLFEETQSAARQYPNARTAVGVHSLRAATAEDLLRVFEDAPKSIPRHIHLAEQAKEVERCREFLGVTPVSWLLDHADVDDRFHLVHATHIDATEVQGSSTLERRLCSVQQRREISVMVSFRSIATGRLVDVGRLAAIVMFVSVLQRSFAYWITGRGSRSKSAIFFVEEVAMTVGSSRLRSRF